MEAHLLAAPRSSEPSKVQSSCQRSSLRMCPYRAGCSGVLEPAWQLQVCFSGGGVKCGEGRVRREGVAEKETPPIQRLHEGHQKSSGSEDVLQKM